MSIPLATRKCKIIDMFTKKVKSNVPISRFFSIWENSREAVDNWLLKQYIKLNYLQKKSRIIQAAIRRNVKDNIQCHSISDHD